jgi:hypothetical protein
MNAQLSIGLNGDQLLIVAGLGPLSFTIPLTLEQADQHIKALAAAADHLRSERRIKQSIILGKG